MFTSSGAEDHAEDRPHGKLPSTGEDGSIVVGKISENETYTYGYDAQEGQYGDLISKVIIDPTKLVRTALQDATSIAGLLGRGNGGGKAQEGDAADAGHASWWRYGLLY